MNVLLLRDISRRIILKKIIRFLCFFRVCICSCLFVFNLPGVLVVFFVLLFFCFWGFCLFVCLCGFFWRGGGLYSCCLYVYDVVSTLDLHQRFKTVVLFTKIITIGFDLKRNCSIMFLFTKILTRILAISVITLRQF